MLNSTNTSLMAQETYSSNALGPHELICVNSSQADSLTNELLKIEAYQDKLDGVTHYLSKSDQEISFEDYWYARQFEAQPMVVIGKLMHETAFSIYQGLKTLTKGVGNGFSTSWEWLKDTFYRKNCMYQEDNLILTQKIEDALIKNNLESILDACYDGESLIQHHLQFNQEMDNQFTLMMNELRNGLELARLNNKPLLILVGETHNELNSAYHEALLLMIARNIPSIKTVFTEPFASSHYRFPILTLEVIEKIISKFNFERQYMDFAHSQDCDMLFPKPAECQRYTQVEKFTDATDSGMKKRNDVMADVMIKSTLQNAIAIVGGNHLQGLIQETPLKEYYYLLPLYIDQVTILNFLSTISSKIKSPQSEFLLSNQVRKIPEINFESIRRQITTDTIVLNAQQAHDRYVLSQKKTSIKV